MIDKYDEIAFCLALFVPCALSMTIFFIILLKDEVSDIYSDLQDKISMLFESIFLMLRKMCNLVHNFLRKMCRKTRK